jgi:hypothetical protein
MKKNLLKKLSIKQGNTSFWGTAISVGRSEKRNKFNFILGPPSKGLSGINPWPGIYQGCFYYLE